MKKIYLLSLGCPRNLIDSEVLQGLLDEKGFTLIEEAEGADAAIVNTCGFIEDAKQESIDAILQLAELKRDGKIGKLIVAGCLSQRYPVALTKDISEIDGIFGTADFVKIPEMIQTIFAGEKIKEVTRNPNFLYDDNYERKLLTPGHYAYVKIQEGCSNRCSYCVIPDLKGPRRSRTIESVLREVKDLKTAHNVKEVVLIGQDTTSFGIDTGGKSELAGLLKSVSSIMGDSWVRLLYTHPAHFTDELIDVIAGANNICKYVDLPIQHASDKILQKMKRKASKSEITNLIKKIRGAIEGVTLRTSVIVGFPGETDDDFAELIDFLKDVRFDKLGAFIYSPEEGTEAVKFDGQVPEEIKKKRFDEIMKLQQEISLENNLRYTGKILKTLIDEQDESDPGQFVGRTEMDAPEVDGVIYFCGKDVKPGEFTDVKITGSMEYDLIGEAA